jgi:hypothetical protein
MKALTKSWVLSETLIKLYVYHIIMKLPIPLHQMFKGFINHFVHHKCFRLHAVLRKEGFSGLTDVLDNASLHKWRNNRVEQCLILLQLCAHILTLSLLYLKFVVYHCFVQTTIPSQCTDKTKYFSLRTHFKQTVLSCCYKVHIATLRDSMDECRFCCCSFLYSKILKTANVLQKMA